MADIFNADELAADAVTIDNAPQEAPEPQEGPARDEHGRFAARNDDVDPPEPEAPAAEGEPAPEGDPQRPVPHGALHAEREKHKGTKAQLEEAQRQLQALATMRQQIQSRQPAPIQAPEADPASETAYLRQRLEELEGTTSGIVQRDQLAQVEHAEYQQLQSVLVNSEAEFRASSPDYDEAINYVVQARAQELMLYGLSRPEIEKTLREEVADITRSAIQQGRNPAEVGYQLAKLRGYRSEGGQPAPQQPGNAQRVIEAVGAARAGSRSLGQASGTGTTRQLDAKALVDMSPEEFDAIYSTPDGKRMIDAL